MSTVETRLDHTPVTALESQPKSACGESRVDQLLSLAAIIGAVVGAMAGTVLGAEADTAYPVLCGTLGTMLGSPLAAGGWHVFARLWAALLTEKEVSHERGAAELLPTTPTSSAR